jgi:hypothetical protein
LTAAAIKRRPDWRPRLATFVESRRREATTDCGLFVADAIVAMTGVDLAAPYRGRYTTTAEGVALLKADGFADLCDFAASRLVEVHPSLARAGDVVALRVSAGTGWALGLVNGERVTVLYGTGLGTVLRDVAERAFRVPE